MDTRISANARGNLKALWGFALVWNVVSVPVLVYVPPELRRNPVAAIGFVFPIAGVGLLLWAVLSTLRWRRFGESWLEAPAATAGSAWTATVHARLPQPEQPDAYVVVVRLSCLQRTVSRSNNESNVQERIVWREELEVPAHRISFGADGAAIPVRFDIPADALPTSAVGKGPGVLWVLTAEAALAGVNLKEDFDVPVSRGTGVAAATPAARAQSGAAAAITPDDLLRTGVTVKTAAQGTAITFAPRRNPAFAVGISAFAAVWTGALWLQWFLGVPWIFPIVTGLFDLLLVWIVTSLWFGTTTVNASAGEVRVRRSTLGLGGTRTVAAADVAALELHIGMQTQGRFGTPYYDVRARLKNGRKVTLGSGVRNKRHAEWLADRIASAAGIKRAA